MMDLHYLVYESIITLRLKGWGKLGYDQFEMYSLQEGEKLHSITHDAKLKKVEYELSTGGVKEGAKVFATFDCESQEGRYDQIKQVLKLIEKTDD